MIGALLLPMMLAAAPDAGREVYQSVCIACHAPENVMVSSPKAGDSAEWQRRSAQAGGLEGLLRNAAKGVGAMPARGGRPELSEEQLRAAIRYMMEP